MPLPQPQPWHSFVSTVLTHTAPKCLTEHDMTGSHSCCTGIAPVRKLLDTKVNVGMGVDGSASSDSGHLLQEVRLAMLLQRASGSAQGGPQQQALPHASLCGRTFKPSHAHSMQHKGKALLIWHVARWCCLLHSDGSARSIEDGH